MPTSMLGPQIDAHSDWCGAKEDRTPDNSVQLSAQLSIVTDYIVDFFDAKLNVTISS